MYSDGLVLVTKKLFSNWNSVVHSDHDSKEVQETHDKVITHTALEGCCNPFTNYHGPFLGPFHRGITSVKYTLYSNKILYVELVRDHPIIFNGFEILTS